MPRKVKAVEPEIAAVASAAAAPAPKRAPRARKTAAATHKTRAAKPAPVERAKPRFHPEMFQEEIARQAYLYWLERGAGHGRAGEDWHRAEAEIRRRWEAGQ
jgi:hypothetical protein